jgi:hypothetical protein
MKELISTKFFLTLQEASQTGIAVNTHELGNCFEEFVMLLFSQGAAFSCKVAFHNALEYTRVELTGLTEEVSGKKCTCFSEKGYFPY